MPLRYSGAIRNPIAEFLAQRPVMILDGALATELQRRGADLHDPLWSARVLLEQPQLIRALHLDYFVAGADVATTASYQASFEGFGHRGIHTEEALRLMRDSVTLALAARDEFWDHAGCDSQRLLPLVAASVGPYGAVLADGSEYRGHYPLSDTELMNFHRPRMQVLAASGADLLACETIPSLREALVLARLLEELPGTTAWIGFSCRDPEHTCEGQPIGECAAALDGFAQVVSVGVNCTAPRYVGSLLQRLHAHTAKPLLAYPRSGQHYPGADGGTLALQAQGWYAAGARLIGGCCGTTPDDIRRLREGLPRCV